MTRPRRPQEAQYLPAKGDTDPIERAAVRVRIDRPHAPVHTLDGTARHHTGRLYRAACGVLLEAAGGAVLTTRDTTCPDCLAVP